MKANAVVELGSAPVAQASQPVESSVSNLRAAGLFRARAKADAQPVWKPALQQRRRPASEFGMKARRLGWLLGLLLVVRGAPLGAADRPPNIVLIYADDIGYGDFGCYGATAVKTPNVDRLAREGLRFTNGHATSATCTPSRYSMLTGEYAFRKQGTGVLPGDAALIIEPGRTTLASLLQRAGYRTGGLPDGRRRQMASRFGQQRETHRLEWRDQARPAGDWL